MILLYLSFIRVSIESKEMEEVNICRNSGTDKLMTTEKSNSTNEAIMNPTKKLSKPNPIMCTTFRSSNSSCLFIICLYMYFSARCTSRKPTSMKRNKNSETPIEITPGTKIRNNREMKNPALKLRTESRCPTAKPEIP